MARSLKHFDLFQVKSGIYALINRTEGWGIANSGLIDLGGISVVFDSTMTPKSAQEIVRVSGEVGIGSINLIINSHYHNDHIWGNQVFPAESLIVSSETTRKLILTNGQEELDWYQANSGERLAVLESTKGNIDTPEVKLWRTYFYALVESLPDIRVRYPDITFKDRLEIHGSQRTAQIITYQNGHTGCDAIVYLPDDGVVFMSDLLFTDFHPFLSEAHPATTISILNDILEYDAEVFVPGHGPIATAQELFKMREYIEVCMDIAQEHYEMTRSEATLDEIAIPDAYSSWHFSNFFYGNLHHCYRLCAV